MTSITDITIEEYTPKSIVVFGETAKYKDYMKALGGTWNARLTSKDTGEKFGGWIFPISKQAELLKWKKAGVNTPVSSSVVTENDYDKKLNLLMKRIDKLEMMVEVLSKNKKETVVDYDSDEESFPQQPVRRLLKK
jgi:hypothetical protein